MPQIATSHNIGFAKAGVNFSCVESFVIISRKKPFRFLFFCKFENENGFLLGAVLIKILGVKAPPSQSRFPLAVIPLLENGVVFSR